MLHRSPSDAAPERILLYSHDSYGLGHLRRTLTLAGALVARRPGASILIVSGSPCATHFALPRGVEIVKLPSVTKNDAGEYAPRSLHGGLDQLERLRRSLLRQAFETFDPHLLIADHQPIGLDGELLDVLRLTRTRGTRTILGLRDIIDDPKNKQYPLALDIAGRDNCAIGRLRIDCALDNGLAFWVVGDQLLKGAALNAVQIAECL